MADRNTIRRVVREFALKRRDAIALRDRLTDAKASVYEATLRDLAEQLRLTAQPQVSGVVRLALQIEAGNHSRSIVNTFNRDLAEYAFRFGRLLDEGQLRSTLQAWVENRNAQRAPVIAVTEMYAAYFDALMAGFMQAGLGDALFDFGGHPELGDEPAECIICAALEARSPHPLRDVIRIGTPHPACRQNWHARNMDALVSQLEDRDVQLGAVPAGIVGKASLIDRAGGRRQAAKAILAGRLPR